MVSLTQSCSFWYGLKDLFTLHSCPMTSQAVEGTWIRMGAYKSLRGEWIKKVVLLKISCPSLSYKYCLDRAIFLWPWNQNAHTNQKQQTNENRATWLECQTDRNTRGFWLVKRTLGWKNFMPQNFLEINWYFALTWYCNTIGQSNNAFSILGFSLAGKWRVHVSIFSFIGW